MSISASLPSALAALATGLALLAVIGLVLRWQNRRGARNYGASPVSLPAELAEAEAAVLVAQAGGRVLYANAVARRYFDLNGQDPDLWALSSHVQPRDSFIELFARAGTVNLLVGERRLQATSLHVPVDEGGAQRFVVVLREAAARPELSGGDDAQRAIATVADLAREISGSLDLGRVLDAILTVVGRLFQYNVAEIALWDEAVGVLRPARYIGDRDYEREVSRIENLFYGPDEGYAGRLITQRAPLLVGDIDNFAAVRPRLEKVALPFRSYVGLPLTVNERLLGTLELISYKAEAYASTDLPLLSAIASQAAVAIDNAQTHAEQQQRVQELGGVADLAGAIEATASPRELYQRLTSDIARLMGVQIVGFLLHESAAAALVPQKPFFGLPDIVVDLYRWPLTAGSAAERIWREDEYWMSNDLPHEPLVDEAGVRQVVETAGLTGMLVAPIAIGERRLGLLQVSNKASGKPFTESDARLLAIFAGQCAAVLDNARLVSEAEDRAAQAEGLREIAASTAAGTNLDAILRAAMPQIARLVRCDTGIIALLDEARGELAPHPASAFGGLPEEAEAIRLKTDDPFFAFSVTRTRRPFLTGRALRDRRVAHLYKALVEHYQMNSLMDVPLVVGDRALGELMVGSRRENAFSETDLQMLSTVASQLASAIERARLYDATDQNLQRRVEQLTALTRVGRELNQTLDHERILRLVYNEALTATQASCGTIVLLKFTGEAHEVQLRIGEENLGWALTPLEAEVVAGGRLRHAVNLQPLDKMTAHPEVRAALIVPISVQGAVLGLLHLHRHRVEGFDDTDIETAVALAAQTAVAVGNALRYDEQLKRGELLRRRADQLAQLFQISRTVRTDAPLAANLQAIAFGLQEAVGFNVVLVSVLDPQTRRLRRTASAGIPLATFEEIRKVEQPWDNFQRALTEEFHVSQSYFLPHEKALAAVAALDTLTLSDASPEKWDPATWHPDDMLIVPLLGSGREPIGVLTADDPRDRRRPDRGTIEIIEIFANQAALAIENARLYQASERRTAQLLALHRVVETATAIADRSRIWPAVAASLVEQLKVDVCLITLLDGDRSALRGQAGALRPEVDFGPLLEALTAGASPAMALEPVVALDTTSAAWQQNPLVLAAEVTSFIAVPIASNGRAAGTLFVGSRRTPSPLTAEDADIFTILANQLGGSLESARLERDIRERAGQLAALAEASQSIAGTLDIEDVVRAVLIHLRAVVPYDSVTLWLREGDELKVAAAQGFENDAERIGVTVAIEDSALFRDMADSRTALLVPDVRQDARFPAWVQLPTRSWLGAPLNSKGRIIGALALDKREEQFYSAQSAQVLVAFANQAAVAVENARLYAEIEARVAARTQDVQRERERVETLLQITTELSTSLDLDRVLTRALQLVTDAVSASQASIFMIDLQSDQLVYRAALGRPTPLPPGGELSPLKRDEGLIGWVIKNRQPIVIGNLEQDERWIPLARHEGRHKSALAVPLMASEEALGAMILLSGEYNAFDEDQMRLVAAAANQVGAAINNAELYRLIRDQAERLGGMLRGQQVEATKSRAILEGIADGVLVADADGQVILFNAASERILQLKRDQIVGRPVTEFIGIYGAAGKAWVDAITSWSLNPNSHRPGEFFSERLELDDQRVISVHLAPVTTADEFLGSVSVIRDITREVEVDRLKSEFVTNVSHELRTPMTSIKGYADILLMGAAGPLTDNQAKFLEVIKNNADRLSVLVNDLLDISRIESGQVELKLRPVNVAEVIQDVVAVLRGRVKQDDKPMAVETDVPPDLPPVWADRERATQIIMNLADNAFNYTPERGTLTLRARLGPKGDEMIVEVEDTGVGVPPGDRARLFDRFYRGEDALVLATAGTGLGLPIAKQLAERHGGRLWLARSEAGQGSTFALALPLAPREK